MIRMIEHNENISQMRDISINDMDPGADGSRVWLSGHIGLMGLVPGGLRSALDGTVERSLDREAMPWEASLWLA